MCELADNINKLFPIGVFRREGYNREECIKKQAPHVNEIGRKNTCKQVTEAKKKVFNVVVEDGRKIAYNGEYTMSVSYKIAINELIAEGHIEKVDHNIPLRDKNVHAKWFEPYIRRVDNVLKKRAA
jgi:hypothetical protein